MCEDTLEIGHRREMIKRSDPALTHQPGDLFVCHFRFTRWAIARLLLGSNIILVGHVVVIRISGAIA